MLILIVILSIVLTLFILKSLKSTLKKYDFGFYYIDKVQEQIEAQKIQEAMAQDGAVDINMLRPSDYSHAMDLRGTPTHTCPCGCQIWNVKVIFEDHEIATYFLDMECANCGSVATAPTPVDKGFTN